MKSTWLPRSSGFTPFLVGDHNIAVEIGGALLEFGEVLDRLQGTLRAEESLDVDAAKRQRLDTMAKLLRPGSRAMCRGVWWPFEWQSKQAAAQRSAASTRRSSVALNCCCGKGVSNRRSPSSCLGVRMPLNIS